MASKPAELPRWATAPSADKDAPSEGRKDSGFTPGAPDRDEMNWLFNVNGQWADFTGKNFDASGKLTLDSANGTVAPLVSNADLHVLQHAHTGAGLPILRTGVMRLDGITVDATRRAQAPLDRSLYVPSLVKAVVELTWSGGAWTVAHGHNVGSTVFESDDTLSYEIGLLDFGAITGVVQTTITGVLDFDGTSAPRYFSRGEVDPGGALRWRGRWFNGTTWQDWRPSGPPVDTVTLVMTVF